MTFQGGEAFFVVRGGRNDDAIDATLQQQIEVGRFFFRVFVGVAQNGVKALLGGGIFYPARDGGPEGIGDIGQEQGDGVRLFGAQALGEGVRDVVQFVDRFLHAFAGGGVDAARIVHHAGDRDRSNACQFGHILNIDHARSLRECGAAEEALVGTVIMVTIPK